MQQLLRTRTKGVVVLRLESITRVSYVSNTNSVCQNSNNLFRFDGQQFATAGSSKYSHKETLGMANYMGKALTTGCGDSSTCYVKTELMDMTTLRWTDGPDYPFTSE